MAALDFCRPIRIALIFAALAAATPAAAQMYKWTDERGGVTYSNTPPPATSKGKVETISDRVTVYATDEETKRAMSREARRDAKVANLERQLEAERAARRSPGPAPDATARMAADYERCIAQRRVDCDSLRADGTGLGYPVDGFVYVPAYAIGSHGPRGPLRPPRFVVSDTPLPRIGVDNRPPVGISTAPRVGIDDRPPVGVPPRSRTVGQFR